MRVRLASDGRADAPPAALAVAMRRVMQLPGLLLVIAVAMVASWHLDYSSRVRTIALICLGGGAGLAVALLLGQRLGVIKRVRLPKRVQKIRAELTLARAEAKDGTHPFRRATLRGLLFWVVVVLSQACFIKAVGIQAPIEYAAVVVATVNAISMLPISVGGYGLREGAFSALLGVAAVGTAAQGTAVGLLLSAQTLLFGLLGAVFYVTLPRRERTAANPPSPPVQAPGSDPATQGHSTASGESRTLAETAAAGVRLTPEDSTPSQDPTPTRGGAQALTFDPMMRIT
jgi:hypothetical protein